MTPHQISDDPVYGFKRKAELAAINIGLADFAGKFVKLMLLVKYYESDSTTLITLIPPKVVTLTADETTWVDASGNIVAESDPNAVMTEYDFFIMLMDQPIIISNLVAQKISWADSQAGGNRFDL
jgi:hypothetical protein